MKRQIAVLSLLLILTVSPALAQLGSGIVYDPTNYQNAVLRYAQLQKQLLQLQQTYNLHMQQYQLILGQTRQLQNMVALVIAFCFAMVKYYSTAIPGFGMSFPDLVMQEASSLSNNIGMDQARLIETKVTEVEQGMEQPGSLNFHETLTFVVLYVILATVQAVVLMIIGFGLIAQAVLLLVGPVFIPFFIVPKMDWLFWGWFKSFLQYSFYQVVASAFVYIFGKLLLAFFAVDTGGMTVEQWMTAFPAMFIFLLIAIYGLLKIPALTNHLFSGAAGGDSGLAAAMAAYVSRG